MERHQPCIVLLTVSKRPCVSFTQLVIQNFRPTKHNTSQTLSYTSQTCSIQSFKLACRTASEDHSTLRNKIIASNNYDQEKGYKSKLGKTGHTGGRWNIIARNFSIHTKQKRTTKKLV